MIKEFISRILALDNKLLLDKIARLRSELNVERHNIIVLQEELDWSKEINTIQKKSDEIKFETLKAEYIKLLNKGKLNILDLKDWYETKYENSPWKYNFNGTKKQDTKNCLKDTPSEAKALTTFARELILEYGLTADSKVSKIPESVIKHFKKKANWTYAFDKDYYKLTEFWQRAGESLKRRKGDCDDLAILMHNTVYYMLKELGILEHYWRIKIACGRLVGYGGHAFNIWLHDDGEWYVIESTYDLANSYKKTWLKTPIKNNNLYRDFWGFIRKDRSWLSKYSSLQPYK